MQLLRYLVRGEELSFDYRNLSIIKINKNLELKCYSGLC